jgi:hypothetical protein
MGQTASEFIKIVRLIRQMTDFLIVLNEYYCHLSKKGKVKRNRHRNRGYALIEVEFLSDSEFRRQFRLSRPSFKKLEGLTEAFMEPLSVQNAINSSGSIIGTKTRLMCTLRWLAGGSYIDICFAYGVSKTAFFQNHGVLWGTMDAIDIVLKITFPFDDYNELLRISNQFSAYNHGHIKGCVLAIDGWVCRTRKPFHSEVEHITAYRNRHDCWGIVCLAGCDANLKFRMFSAVSCGSTNDSLAWEISNMFKFIETDRRLHRDFFIVGDEAFVTTDQVLSPFPGRGLGTWKDSFNYHLSSMRQCIERAFGLLTQRWGIFWRPLRCAATRWTLVCQVCAKLHNFCIDENESIIHDRYEEDNEDGDENVVLLNDETEDQAHTRRASGNRRNTITEYLQTMGFRRPIHAAMNSRA